MTLREQIRDITVGWINHHFADMVSLSIVVDQLAAMAFDRGITPDSCLVGRVIARARVLMRSPGWITEEEPGIE